MGRLPIREVPQGLALGKSVGFTRSWSGATHVRLLWRRCGLTSKLLCWRGQLPSWTEDTSSFEPDPSLVNLLRGKQATWGYHPRC
jgi:hypothetical protein